MFVNCEVLVSTVDPSTMVFDALDCTDRDQQRLQACPMPTTLPMRTFFPRAAVLEALQMIKNFQTLQLFLTKDLPGSDKVREAGGDEEISEKEREVWSVKVRDVSSTVVKLQLSTPFAVARTQSVCCQLELTQGLEP